MKNEERPIWGRAAGKYLAQAAEARRRASSGSPRLRARILIVSLDNDLAAVMTSTNGIRGFLPRAPIMRALVPQPRHHPGQTLDDLHPRRQRL